MAGFFESPLQVIPSALGVTKKGDVKPLTASQRQTDATPALTSLPDIPVQTPTPKNTGLNYQEPQSRVQERTAAQADAAAQAEATPVADAFKESLGGYTRDLYRIANQKEGAKEVDPNYDAGVGRDAFRKKYGEEHWAEYERTRNQSQADVLIERLDEQNRRNQVMGESLVGTMGGALLDPISLLTGGTILKGATTAAKMYNLSKYTAVAAGAVTEGTAFAGLEAGIQSAEFGEVYDPTAVATTFGIATALHFGAGALTPKSLYTKPVTEADAMIAQARQDMADYAQARVKAFQSGERVKPPEVRAQGITEPLRPQALEDTPTPTSVASVPTDKYFTPDAITIQSDKDGFFISSKNLNSSKDKELYSLETSYKKDSVMVINTRVSPELRGQGIGKRMYVAAINDALSKGLRFTSDTSVSADALRVYKSLEKDGYKFKYNIDDNTRRELNKGNTEQLINDSRIPLVELVSAPEVPNNIVNAGSAANTIRQGTQSEPIIRSESQAVQDAADIGTMDDQAYQAIVGEKMGAYLASPAGKLSAKFSNTLQGLSSTSPIVRSAARLLGADPTGIARKAERSTAYDKVKYNNLARDHYSGINDEYSSWVKRNGRGGFASHFTTHNEVEFNKLLREEMEMRWRSKDDGLDAQRMADEERWQSTAPEVKRAADKLDAGNQVLLDYMKKHGVLGADNLSDISRGYVPRRMNGKSLQDLHRTNPTGFKNVKALLGQRYFESFTAKQQELIKLGEKITPITPEKANTIAQGVIERAINRAAGTDGTTLGLFDRAARDEIKSILESKGMDYTDIEHTFGLLDKKLGTRTGSNRLKGRIDVDLSSVDETTGIRLLDYFDNDLNKLSHSYSEEMSGRIALAKQGIKSDVEMEHIISAIKNENKSTDVNADIKLIKDMHSVLLGRPLDGQGTNKVVQLLTQLNPLQVLGQVGFAQAAETSLIAARLGMGSALKSIPVLSKIVVGARTNALSTSDTALLKEMESVIGPIGQSWRIHRPSTDVMERLNSDGAIAHTVDKLLKTGQHINGFVSMMHQIMESQLKVVAVSGSKTFASEIRAGKLTKRIEDAGFTEESMAAIKRDLDAHAKFDNDELIDLNLSKWSSDNADHFMTNIQRLSGQIIQSDFAGESASWMHKDLGRMLISLRGYSVRAFNKQLVRNVQIGDAVAATTIMYGMAFSTAAYTAKAYTMSTFRDDKEEFLKDRLSGNNLAFGVIGYMSMGSFGPEILRPLVSWGSDSKADGALYTMGDTATAIVPAFAPAVRVATDIGNIGKAVGQTIRGNDSGWTPKKTKHLVQTALGNNVPLSLLMNAATSEDE